MKLPSQPANHSAPHGHRGVSIVEVLIAIAVIGLVLSLTFPLILSARETARRAACQSNLKQLGRAMGAYHEAYGRFPVAGVWSTDRLDSLALNRSRRVDLYTHANWAQALLPFAGQSKLASSLDSDRPIAARENESARKTRLPLMTCPTDPFNTAENLYALTPDGRKPILFARGNYAINGGTHCFKDGSGSTAYLNGDNSHLVMSRETREFRFWGNGVAGFNVNFSLDDFENGTSSLVMLNELRAGVDPIDPRGVWALGQIGGSVTWGHGVNGDAYGPNNQEPRSDDLLDGDVLNKKVGADFLRSNRMPCVSYVNLNYQAASRSAHVGGVHLLMVDGTSRFISDTIDPGLWHVMHSRETPPRIIGQNLDSLIARSFQIPEKIEDGPRAVPDRDASPTIENSAQMKFALIPDGEFEMGLADEGNSDELPGESPAHKVQISGSFYLGIQEVTRSQYQQITGDALDRRQSPAELAPEIANWPVTDVTWDQATEFCRKLSELPAEQAASRRYRLPTEAEWEYACRAGSKARYRWSETRLPGDTSGDAAGINPPLPLCSVGSYPPNPFGLYDMRGNAWEWCADWFDRDYYARSPSRDPMGPRDGYIKVVRGSSWTYIGEKCKLSYPHLPPWKSSPFVGFRVVCEFHAGASAVATRQ